MHLLLGLVKDILVQASRLFVVRVAVIIVQVSLERLPTLSLGVSGIRATLLFEAIAVVPARAMLRPHAHAHPAEFIPAFAACHVVATTVLLNRGMAFRALLCVRRYPIGSLRIVLAFLQPSLD